MLGVEDWAEIRRLHRADGVSISQIARVMGISRNTVKAALASDGGPEYQRAPAGSLVDDVERWIGPRVAKALMSHEPRGTPVAKAPPHAVS